MAGGPGRLRYNGVHPILYAFYGPDGRLDPALLELQVDVCLAAGANGIAVLGLVTEIFRLSTAERAEVVRVVAARIAGRVPLMVTVGEASVHATLDAISDAAGHGASIAIIQPPPVRGVSERELMRFLGEVADRAAIPVGVQNNPTYMDVALPSMALLSLHRQHPNITMMKAEGPAVDVAAFALEASATCDVFAGHGGIEWPTNLRSGCQGLIPAPELVDVQCAIWRLWSAGEFERAEALHRAVLPVVVFMSRSLPGLIAYGKRLMALRMGIGDPAPRVPDTMVTPFGLQEVARFATMLGPLRATPGAMLSPAVRRAAGMD